MYVCQTSFLEVHTSYVPSKGSKQMQTAVSWGTENVNPMQKGKRDLRGIMMLHLEFDLFEIFHSLESFC